MNENGVNAENALKPRHQCLHPHRFRCVMTGKKRVHMQLFAQVKMIMLSLAADQQIKPLASGVVQRKSAAAADNADASGAPLPMRRRPDGGLIFHLPGVLDA